MNISEAIRDSTDPTKHPSEWVPVLMEFLTNRDTVKTCIGIGRPVISLVRIKQLLYTWRLSNQALPCPYHDCDATISTVQASFAAGRLLNPLGGQFDEHWNEFQGVDSKHECDKCSRPMKYSVGVLRGPFWECSGGE